NRAALEHPRQRDLRRGGIVALRDLIEAAARLRELARGQREPRDERDIFALAVIEDGFTLARDEVVQVLDTDDREEFARRLDLFDVDFAQADMADQTLALHVSDNAELLVARGFIVDAVKLPQVDALDVEAAQAHQD